MSATCHTDEISLPPLSAKTTKDALWQRALILSLPFCMFVAWITVLSTGQGRVDAMGNPVGGDFAMFYIAGQMARQGEWSVLYDEPLQQARLLELMPSLPGDSYLPYRYPPVIAILAAPLTMLPYWAAFILYTCASLTSWLLSIHILVRTFLPRPDATTATAVLAIAVAPVMLQSLIDGQASTWWFAIAVGCWCSLQRGQTVTAGALLALAACKPNVMLLLGVVLILRFPRMLIGFVATGCGLLSLTLLVAGTECLAAYIELGKQLAVSPWSVETPYWKVQSLLSWTELFVGPAARRINLVVGLSAAVGIGIWWRGHRTSQRVATEVLCASLLVNALFNPYTPVYDLTLLCLGAFACVAGLAGRVWRGTDSTWLKRRDVQSSLAIILFCPIMSQAIAKAFQSGLQVMPLCLLGIAGYWFVRRTFKGRPAVAALQ